VTPIKHFEAVWDRCAELSALHAYLAANLSGALHPDELLRAEWVSRVCALDLYVHELVAQLMIEIFAGRRPTTPAYLRFEVSNETLDRIRAASTPSDAGAAFDLEVRNQISYLTFQDPEKIAEAVRLCSAIELWNTLASHLGATAATQVIKAQDLKKNLSLIVKRRNRIAHEGDLQPSPLREPWPITQADLVFVKDHIEQIVRAIDAVV
jgi:hypothetical protein